MTSSGRTLLSPAAWVASPSPRPDARLRLFCLPYAGAGAAPFVPWAKQLPRAIEVCPIRLPGRETRLREAPYRRLPSLVEALADALRPHLDKPFAFFGHSLGALVSFELASRLRLEHGVEPVHLFVSGRRAPQLPEPDPPICHLPDDAFVKELVHRYDGIPRAILGDDELLEVFLPALRADCEVLETYTYRHRDPLRVPISALGGREDDRVSEQDLAAWAEQTTGAFRLRLFPGDHFFLHTCEKLVLEAVTSDLADSCADRLEVAVDAYS